MKQDIMSKKKDVKK